MERHKCKLCSRSFTNGRALGGHMKAHLATFPLPPKPAHQLGGRDSVSSSSSYSSSSSSDEDEENLQRNEEEEEEKASLVYELRENPKKSVRLPDREFSFAGSISIVQDGESETESKNPTRRRSKRTRRMKIEMNQPPPCWGESSAEPEPASSVSDTSPEEDVAMCLVMLSMDRPMSGNGGKDRTPESKKSAAEIEGLVKIKSKKPRAKNRCEKCRKSFRSNRALNGHRKICSRDEEEDGNGGNWKIFKCPYCYKVFGSGQALGGHKRSHLLGSTRTAIDANSTKLEISLDLNLPAPVEEDDYSVVSDAQ